MIPLSKGPTPAWLDSTAAAAATVEYVAWRTSKDAGQPVGAEPTPWRRDDIKEALVSEANGKCIYCESKMLPVSWGDSEHIRPKKLFPGDALKWSNLGLCCTRCNGTKGERWDDVEPIVSPFDDVPSEHLEFVDAFVSAKSGRGATTISHVSLNRAELIERRQALLASTRELLFAAEKARAPHHRDVILRTLRERTAQDEYYASFLSGLVRMTQPLV